MSLVVYLLTGFRSVEVPGESSFGKGDQGFRSQVDSLTDSGLPGVPIFAALVVVPANDFHADLMSQGREIYSHRSHRLGFELPLRRSLEMPIRQEYPVHYQLQPSGPNRRFRTILLDQIQYDQGCTSRLSPSEAFSSPTQRCSTFRWS